MIATKPQVLSRKAAVVSASVASTSPMTPQERQARNKKTRIDDKAECSEAVLAANLLLSVEDLHCNV